MKRFYKPYKLKNRYHDGEGDEEDYEESGQEVQEHFPDREVTQPDFKEIGQENCKVHGSEIIFFACRTCEQNQLCIRCIEDNH